MVLESLADYVRRPGRGNQLNQIYRAHLLQEKISQLLGEGVTVTLRGTQVRLWCQSAQLVALANLKKTKILATCHQTLGQAELKLIIKLKS